MYHREDVGYCVTGKRKYRTERDARTALVGAIVARNSGKHRRKEVRIYECPVCVHWHLTSAQRVDYETRVPVHCVQRTAADDSTGSDDTSTLSGQVFA